MLSDCICFVWMFEARTKSKKYADSGKATRLAVLHCMKALDHALGLVVGGLNTFASLGSVPILKPSEIRCVADRKRPCPFPFPSHVKQVRSCKCNVDSQKASWEVKISERGGSCCVFHYDEGPRDLPVFWYLPHVGFRTIGFNDPLHTVGRDMYEAASESDMWAMVLDTTAVLNWDHGPYLSASNFKRSAYLAERSLAVGNCDDDVWAIVLFLEYVKMMVMISVQTMAPMTIASVYLTTCALRRAFKGRQGRCNG